MMMLFLTSSVIMISLPFLSITISWQFLTGVFSGSRFPQALCTLYRKFPCPIISSFSAGLLKILKIGRLMAVAVSVVVFKNSLLDFFIWEIMMRLNADYVDVKLPEIYH